MVEKKYEIEQDALAFIGKHLKSRAKKIELKVGFQPIYIFGHHGSHLKEMEEIRDRLKEEYTLPVKLVKEHPDSDHLPDFEKEKAIIEQCGVLVFLDAEKGGVVGETTYLLDKPHILEKSLLLVSKENEDKLLSTKLHYLYFPSKIVYKGSEDLIEKGVEATRQATYRLAIAELNTQENDKEKNI